MASNATFPEMSCIDDNGAGAGAGQYYECTEVRVMLNLQEMSMLYSGQLLLVRKKSTNGDSASKPTTSKKHFWRARTSPNSKLGHNAANYIFSEMEDAKFQFTFQTKTTAEGQTTNTTDTSASTSTNIKTSTSESKSTTIFPDLKAGVKTKWKINLNEPALPSEDSKCIFPGAGKDSVPKIKGLSSTSTSTSLTSTATTASADCSQFTSSPFAAPFTTSFTFSTSLTASELKPKVTNTTALKAASSCKRFIDIDDPSCKASSPQDSSPGLGKNQCSSSSSSLFKVSHVAEATGEGSTDGVARKCSAKFDIKYPFPSNHGDHLHPTDENEEDGKKIYPTVKKERSDEKREIDTDYRRPGESQKSRERADNSLQNELLKAQLQCFKIQHSLYSTLVAKLRTMEPKEEVQASDQLSKDVKSDDLQSLLFPLEALLRCSDIQLGLHHGLSVVLDDNKNARQAEEEDCGFTNKGNSSRMMYDKDELLIESRSLMNCTQFAQSLVCLHLANPYTSDLRYACGEDRICLSLLPIASWYVPHGEGKLVSLDGNLIYEGQWKNGKRWGHGKAFIFSGIELSASKKQYGIYEGQWWNNMRHGHGRLVFASCAVYEGEWQYDIMSGVGTMHSPDGSILEGLWDEGEPNGCGMFTWPNGTVEYREYQNGQVVKVLQSQEETKKTSPLNEVMREYSVLRLKHQMLEEEKLRLVQAESRAMVEKAQAECYKTHELKLVTQQKVKQLRGKFVEIFQKKKKKLIEEHRIDLQEMNKRHDDKIKELEDKIHRIEVELEGKKSDLMCQICFERDRNCILMPCSHLLYCQICIAKLHNDVKPARCPACRGSINSQINCNITQ